MQQQAVDQRAQALAINPQLLGRHFVQIQHRHGGAAGQLRVESSKTRADPLDDVQLDRHQRWTQLIQAEQALQLLQALGQSLQRDLAWDRQTHFTEAGPQALKRFVQILMDHTGKTGYVPVFGLGLFVSIA
ncbi:hypothetical protein D3C77_577290 [compost metagenome]